MDVSESDDEKDVLTQEIPDLSSDDSANNNYKILHDIIQLGCSQKALNAAAYRTYLDLCEVRKYDEVSYHYLKELDIIYIKTLKKAGKTEQEIVVPMLASKKFNFKQIEEYQHALESNTINLAICDSNSLVMYYKMTRS